MQSNPFENYEHTYVRDKLQMGFNDDNITIDTIQWRCESYSVMNLLGISDPDMIEIGSATLYQPAIDGPSVMEQVFGTMKMPNNYDRDSIYLYIKTEPSTFRSGNIKFHFYYNELPSTATTIRYWSLLLPPVLPMNFK